MCKGSKRWDVYVCLCVIYIWIFIIKCEVELEIFMIGVEIYYNEFYKVF